ncbi:serine threonine-protein kinase [Nesidiocoris tenuis]|uniref:Serine threonine-protein kinase n=1 Tax=Nesidiocoris tenuis TaxID=355587 RepID=A0ABN7B3H3_9HEMI|nr:serine threonine-protein kinase [Nesidiocoris tenuis]
MCAVDIFSMGCVFFYTIVKGKHPFGEPIRRQSNILSHDYKLAALEEDKLWKTLIMKMISQNPLERPSASTVRRHPVFWSKPYILSFLQDVSDRIEKETVEGEVLRELEMGGEAVCQGDWKQFIDAEVAEDLGKYRSYRGDSIRDLLRALRNKKHHYRELNPVAQEKLGPSAESYITYWLSRYPSLLYHTWSSIQFLRSEPAFVQYYDASFHFPCLKSDFVPAWFSEPIPKSKQSNQTTTKANQLTKPRTPQRQPRFRAKTKKDAVEPGELATEKKETLDKEAWIRSGQLSGAWRPGRTKERNSDMENVVWKLS